jgi:N-acetylmuramoyl-L-alanine amidase
VAIDAGHGGEDPGARGKSGLLEKDVSLAISRRLARLINEQPGMKAVLTRDGDYYVGLRERVQKARQAQADLFVSVHCNALNRSDMHGTAVYVLSPRGATNEHARWLANQENSADLVGGIEIQDKDHELAAVLIDLSQSATMEASFDLGNRLLSSLGQVNNLQKARVQQAGFVVLKAPDIPSVLIETAFITNPREEQLLASEAYQDKMANSMLSGIKGYFQVYRPQQQIVDSEPVTPRADTANARRGHAVVVSMERKLSDADSASSGMAR